MRAPVRLSASTFALLWAELRLGDLPTALYVPPQGATQNELRALEQRGRDELTGLNLLRGQAGLDPDFGNALRLLARPVNEFYGWFVRENNTALSALVAAEPDQAVLGVLEGDMVWLSSVSATTPAQALVGLAPRVEPARGKSITVPADQFYASPQQPRRGGGRPLGRPEEEQSFSVLQASRPSGGEATVARLRELVTGETDGHGQLFTAARDRQGRRHKSAPPIYYFDTADGRWLLHTSTAQGGAPWLTAAPGSLDALTRILYDTHRRLLAQP